MSKRTIYLIVGLIFLAILGVIILQTSLIRTAMVLNEQRYDDALRDRLIKAADGQEQREEDLIDREVINSYANRRGEKDGSGSATSPLDLGSIAGVSYQFEVRARFANEPLSRRIDNTSLDRELRAELEQANLDATDIQYGVYDAREEKFIIRNGRRLSVSGSDTLRHEDLMQSPYRVAIMSDGGQAPGYLIAYNPRKDRWLFESIWWNLAASLLFVAIILGCFIYTIYVILFQNKLATMKTDFINNMTHEFKTPIATISLATDSINSPKILGNPDKVQRFIKIIKQENKRMNDQVEKVLQMAKLDKNKLKLNLTEVDINEVVSDAALFISLQVEPREGSVETRLEANPAEIEGDLTHISSMINNLLDNANKYSPEKPKIIISTRNVSKGVEITIRDHGLGMSREARKNIFDRFYRVHTGDRHDVKGFGLGLSYVKTITDVHHGTINVKSELGKGSSFIVTLPYRQPQQ